MFITSYFYSKYPKPLFILAIVYCIITLFSELITINDVGCFLPYSMYGSVSAYLLLTIFFILFLRKYPSRQLTITFGFYIILRPLVTLLLSFPPKDAYQLVQMLTGKELLTMALAIALLIVCFRQKTNRKLLLLVSIVTVVAHLLSFYHLCSTLFYSEPTTFFFFKNIQ